MLTTSLMGYGRPFLATGDTSRGLKVVDELNVTKNDLLGLTFWGVVLGYISKYGEFPGIADSVGSCFALSS